MQRERERENVWFNFSEHTIQYKKKKKSAT